MIIALKFAPRQVNLYCLPYSGSKPLALDKKVMADVALAQEVNLKIA
jgi:hypothetical protein